MKLQAKSVYLLLDKVGRIMMVQADSGAENLDEALRYEGLQPEAYPFERFSEIVERLKEEENSQFNKIWISRNQRAYDIRFRYEKVSGGPFISALLKPVYQDEDVTPYPSKSSDDEVTPVEGFDLTDLSHRPVLNVNTRLEILTMNEDAQELLGYRERSNFAKDLISLIHPDDVRQLKKLIKTWTPTAMKYPTFDSSLPPIRIQRKDGKQIVVNLVIMSAIYQDVPTIRIIMREITQEIRQERFREALSKLGRELSAATSSYDAAKIISRTADFLFGWDAFFVATYDRHINRYIPILLIDTVGGDKKEFQGPYDVEEDPSPSFLKTLKKGPQLIHRETSTVAEEGSPYGDEERLSECRITAPFVVRDKNPIGLISVQSYTKNAYDELSLKELELMADYCAAAIMRTQAEEALHISETRYALAAKGANDALWDWNLKTNEVYYSPRWLDMLGLDASEINESPDFWFQRIHPNDKKDLEGNLKAHLQGLRPHFESEHRLRHGNGTYRWMVCRAVAVFDEEKKPLRIAGSLRDITERKYAEEQLLHDAFHDSLTGLPNRALFYEHLSQSLSKLKRGDDYQFAILFLDFDRFKVINDSLGHLIGDILLVKLTRRLEEVLRPGDLFSRLGGDEFAVLIDNYRAATEVIQIAENIHRALSRPVTVEGNEVFTSASIGIAYSSTQYSRPEEILRDADTAMYRAKARGKSQHVVFNKEMLHEAQLLLEMETDLRRAVDRYEFEVHYQPILSVGDSRVVGMEALIRWKHPSRGWIAPDDFIPLAEETGIIEPLGLLAFHESCKQLAEWDKMIGELELYISVNLSARQLSQPGLVDHFLHVLQEHDVDRKRVRLELTESALMSRPDLAVKILQRFNSEGIQILIDDFGTGYSSLSYLQRLPISALKIDKSFIMSIKKESDQSEIISAILGLAGNLGMEVIAEGIETKVQMDKVMELGCDYGQGFLLSRVLSPEAATEYLKNALGSAEITKKT